MKIGPGTLVAVVGPSGAGKDTLISLASKACHNDPAIVFPRRIVTRPPSDAEDHDSLTAAGFDDALARGHFAFWWEAHGHRYGIPKTIDAEIEAGHIVVCNVSRVMIANLREKYGNVISVLITASPEILASRLAGRNRRTDGALDARLARNLQFSAIKTDITILNDKSVEMAAATLSTLLQNADYVGRDDRSRLRPPSS